VLSLACYVQVQSRSGERDVLGSGVGCCSVAIGQDPPECSSRLDHSCGKREILAAFLSLKYANSTALLDVTPCRLVEVRRHFRGGYCLFPPPSFFAEHFLEAVCSPKACLTTRRHTRPQNLRSNLKCLCRREHAVSTSRCPQQTCPTRTTQQNMFSSFSRCATLRFPCVRSDGEGDTIHYETRPMN
jgi:hypothetical protein